MAIVLSGTTGIDAGSLPVSNTGKISAGSGLPAILNTAGVDRVTVDTAGNVGIGTSSSDKKLSVNQNSSIATTSLKDVVQIYAKGYAGAGTYHSGIGFAMHEHSDGYWGSGIISRDDSGYYGSALSFYTSTGSATQHLLKE